jgi:hypothetical protein
MPNSIAPRDEIYTLELSSSPLCAGVTNRYKMMQVTVIQHIKKRQPHLGDLLDYSGKNSFHRCVKMRTRKSGQNQNNIKKT